MNETAIGMSAFAISARAHDLAFVRAILEASEGLGVITGTADGAVRVLSPVSRRDELATLLDDLSQELGFAVLECAASGAMKRDATETSAADSVPLEPACGIR